MGSIIITLNSFYLASVMDLEARYSEAEANLSRGFHFALDL